VTTNIIRTLLERSWIKVVGYRDVPGKPAMYGTTREFLDYFGLKQLEDLPPLAELRDFDKMTAQLELAEGESADEPETAPFSPEPLVRPPVADLPSEPATVASLDEARAAAPRAATPEAAPTNQPASATVIPLIAR
jgi:segregation and condensation protein B